MMIESNVGFLQYKNSPSMPYNYIFNHTELVKERMVTKNKVFPNHANKVNIYINFNLLQKKEST